MKNRTTVIAGLLVALMLLAACDLGAQPTPTVDLWADYAPVVSVTGEVVPALWANVGAQTGGAVVTEVLVEPGDQVAEGDVLMRLDPADAQVALQKAQAALAVAEAQLERLQASARAEEIAIAQAQVESAEAAVIRASAQYDRIQAGSIQVEIAQGEARVAAAEADQFLANELHEETMECFQVFDPTIGDERTICPALGAPEERARYNLQTANRALAAARAQLNALRAGADDRLDAAQAGVSAAEAQQETARSELALLRAGATAEAIAVQQAAVARAQAALDAAQVALDRTEVRAPFAGTVGEVFIRAGEYAAPGMTLITVGDLSTLRVETTDLDEIDVSRVALDQQVSVTFDALPERVFSGRVSRISPKAESGSGGVNYTVVVQVEALDPAIRWGMTAFVDIEVEE